MMLLHYYNNNNSVLIIIIIIRGVSYVNESIVIEKLDNSFVTKRTPRTGICVASNGSLILLQVRIY